MKYALCVALAVLTLAGCRREDVREFTLEFPALNASNRAVVA